MMIAWDETYLNARTEPAYDDNGELVCYGGPMDDLTGFTGFLRYKSTHTHPLVHGAQRALGFVTPFTPSIQCAGFPFCFLL